MPPCQAGHIFPQDAFGFVVGRRADPWPLRAEYAAVRGLQIDLETGQARLLLARPSAMAAPLFSLEAWQYGQPSGDVMWCAATSSRKSFWCSLMEFFAFIWYSLLRLNEWSWSPTWKTFNTFAVSTCIHSSMTLWELDVQVELLSWICNYDILISPCGLLYK